MRTLEQVCETYLQTATEQWHIEGAIIPTLWAIGTDRLIVAQPKNSDAWNDEKHRMGIHALMRSMVRATMIGVIAECWVRQSDIDNFVPKKGHLQTIADRDPSVRTGIIVTGWDVMNAKPRIHMARLDLDNEGSPYWEYDSYDDGQGDTPTRLKFIAEHTLHEVVLGTDTTASVLQDWFMMEAPNNA